MEVHPYYYHLRIGVFSIASVSLVLFTWLIYLDRQPILDFFHGHTPMLATKSGLRIGGLSESIFLIVSAVDQVGAFEIYGTAMLLTLVFVGTLNIVGTFCFAFYRAVFAAFPFIFMSNSHKKAMLRYFMLGFLGLFTLSIFLNQVVHHRAYKVFNTMLTFVLLTVFTALTLATYISLRKHQKFLVKNAEGRSNSESPEFKNLLRQVSRWRYFTLLVLLAYCGIGASHGIQLMDNIQALNTPTAPFNVDTIYNFDKSAPPPGYPIDALTIENVVISVLTYVILWYTWEWKAVRSPARKSMSSPLSSPQTSRDSSAGFIAKKSVDMIDSMDSPPSPVPRSPRASHVWQPKPNMNPRPSTVALVQYSQHRRSTASIVGPNSLPLPASIVLASNNSVSTTTPHGSSVGMVEV